MKNVITITRQFGSLGRYIAQLTAKKMGYAYYDRELIDRTADSMGNDTKELMLMDGRMAASSYGRMMYPLGTGSLYNQEKLFDIEKNVIRYLSLKNNCVFVGRCSDYILKEDGRSNVFGVYVYAPYSARYYFCINNLGLTQNAVMEYMEKVDKARSIFYRQHTGEEVDSVTYRDMMIDSSTASPEDIAEMICFCAEKKFSSKETG